MLGARSASAAQRLASRRPVLLRVHCCGANTPRVDWVGCSRCEVRSPRSAALLRAARFAGIVCAGAVVLAPRADRHREPARISSGTVHGGTLAVDAGSTVHGEHPERGTGGTGNGTVTITGTTSARKPSSTAGPPTTQRQSLEVGQSAARPWSRLERRDVNGLEPPGGVPANCIFGFATSSSAIRRIVGNLHSRAPAPRGVRWRTMVGIASSSTVALNGSSWDAGRNVHRDGQRDERAKLDSYSTTLGNVYVAAVWHRARDSARNGDGANSV